MQAHPHCEDRHRRAGSTTHVRFHMVYIHRHVSSSTYMNGCSVKVSHSGANLICVFICSVSPLSLSFRTSCHHRPSPPILGLEPALSPDSPGKNCDKNLTLIFGPLCTGWKLPWSVIISSTVTLLFSHVRQFISSRKQSGFGNLTLASAKAQ